MMMQSAPRNRLSLGIVYALAAAVLFGASTPFSKLLLSSVQPVLLAALLYLGSGCGLTLWLCLGSWLTGKKSQEAPLKRADFPWLAGAVFFGGVGGPLLLMLGLAATPAADASLLLNLEGVLTALLAWFVFKENFNRRRHFVLKLLESQFRREEMKAGAIDLENEFLTGRDAEALAAFRRDAQPAFLIHLGAIKLFHFTIPIRA